MMIFGKTDREKRVIEQAALRKLKDNPAWFAWHPVKIYDGRWAWLITVNRKCTDEFASGDLYRKDWFNYSYDLIH